MSPSAHRLVVAVTIVVSSHRCIGISAAAEPSARDLLRRAIDHYVAGQYTEAVKTLRPLVDGRALKDQADQKEALRAYGIALYLTGKKPGAERAFRELLRIDPTARLDAAFARPEVVSFFDDVRRRHRQEQTALLIKHGPRGSAVANLLPPWGQFRNGHRKKGYVLLFGELGLMATSVATAAILYSWRSPTGEFGPHEAAYGPLSAINVVSFAALGGLIAYGIIDGLYYYYRRPKSSPILSADPRTTRLGLVNIRF